MGYRRPSASGRKDTGTIPSLNPSYHPLTPPLPPPYKVVHNASSIGFERRIAEGPIEEEASEADDDEEEMLDGEDADAFEEQAALALRI